jgi:hypothetical protein
MCKLAAALSFLSLSAIVTALVGCSGEPTSAPPAAEADRESTPPADVPEAFAELSAADQAVALAQKICPVSGEALGGMGTPIKVSVGGRDVFICCESCKEPLLAEPDKYLAKLETK